MSRASLPELSHCQRALLIKPSSLGDIVHTLPALHLLKQRFPQLACTWLVNPAFASLLEGNPDLAGTLSFPRERFRGAAGLGRFAQWLHQWPRQVPPDVAFDFQGLLRSGLTARASGAPLRLGLSDSREGARFFHSHRIQVDPQAHAIERALALPRAFGAEGPLVFPLPAGTAPAGLGAEAPPGAILLHPFSRGQGKSLSAAQVRRLCEDLAPLPVLLVGRSELPLEGLPAHARSLLNATTLPELIWLIRRARGVISVDSGPMHIAAALTPRVLGLHTWSDPRKVGPWHPGTTVWKAGQLMPSEQLDPARCAVAAAFPDSAIPAVAAWAHRLPPAVSPGERPPTEPLSAAPRR